MQSRRSSRIAGCLHLLSLNKFQARFKFQVRGWANTQLQRTTLTLVFYYMEPICTNLISNYTFYL